MPLVKFPQSKDQIDTLNPELYPYSTRDIKCENDLPVTSVKAVRTRNGSQETVHVFHDSELQLFPAGALRNGDSKAITAAARRLSLVYMH